MAAAAGASIITNDRHLLNLGSYKDVNILRPAEMLKRLGAEHP